MQNVIRFRNWLFLFTWLAVAFALEFHKIVWLPPVSIHQGAQADRAGIALNYARVSMRFWEPRVMETTTKDGITPCEFPLLNYTAAVFYKIFGFNSVWYRLLMWCLMGLGLWAAFDMIYRWLNDALGALLLVFTWYFGSILAFYTANFLPDTASLSFMLLALRQWMIYSSEHSNNRIIYFTILASLACLIKITSLIFVIGILLTTLFLAFRKKTNLAFVWSSFLVFFMVAAWYLYCFWLEKQVGGSYFLMNIALPASVSELQSWFEIFYKNWFTQIFSLAQWGFILFGGIAAIFLKEKTVAKPFVYISLLGIVGFYLLMAGQFRYHDYYAITLLPFALFFMVFGFSALRKINMILAYVIVFGVGSLGFLDAKNGVRLRFTPGSYWYQTFFEPNEFKSLPNWLSQNKVTEDDKVVVAFDINPNVLLYSFQRRGYRINDHSQEYVKQKLFLTETLLVKDEVKFFKMYPETQKSLKFVSSNNGWKLYKLK